MDASSVTSRARVRARGLKIGDGLGSPGGCVDGVTGFGQAQCCRAADAGGATGDQNCSGCFGPSVQARQFLRKTSVCRSCTGGGTLTTSEVIGPPPWRSSPRSVIAGRRSRASPAAPTCRERPSTRTGATRRSCSGPWCPACTRITWPRCGRGQQSRPDIETRITKLLRAQFLQFVELTSNSALRRRTV